MLETGELQQCEEEAHGEKEVPDSAGGEKKCHQNGEGGHDGILEEEEVKAEEPNTNGSADSPITGQQ